MRLKSILDIGYQAKDIRDENLSTKAIIAVPRRVI